jgi:hypothetical protein
MLAGCGSASTPQGVASIPASGGQQATAQQLPPGASATGVPGITMADNASEAELKRATTDYSNCLVAHHDPDTITKFGVKEVETDPDGNYPEVPSDAAARPAAQACLSLWPHPPAQEIPAYNPNYKLDLAKWVNCMTAGGLKVVLTPNSPPGWAYTDAGASQGISPAGEKITVQCEMKAFGEH